MIDAADYLRHLKALIFLNTQITHLTIMREEAQGSTGLFRYRLDLQDGTLVEMFERFHIDEGHIVVTKYSYHWQNPEGMLLKRWDNARHHPEVATHPHHLHAGNTEVRAHSTFSAEAFLSTITVEQE